MADQAAVFESPIRSDYGISPRADLWLSDESAATKLLIRAADDTAAAQQLAVPFGSSRSEAVAEGDVLILGQRPTEWLLVGSAPAVSAMAAGLDRTGHVSVIDHTHSRALFSITGRQAARVMEKICNLDFSDEMTPDGAVVSASVAKVNCDIVRQDVSGIRSYRLACDRSFAQYLFDAVLDAGQEFGAGVAA